MTELQKLINKHLGIYISIQRNGNVQVMSKKYESDINFQKPYYEHI